MPLPCLMIYGIKEKIPAPTMKPYPAKNKSIRDKFLLYF